jgi:ubiquitin C-terminal hydrolase
VTLEACLAKFAAPERLSAADRGSWVCESCADPGAAVTKRITLAASPAAAADGRPPRVIVVHLKRFADARASFVKDRTLVEWDARGTVDIASLLGWPAAADHQYRTAAVIEHLGSRSYGHYTAAVRSVETGEWVRFDDEFVEPLAPDDGIVTSQAYIAVFHLASEKK